jgi:glutamate racemase
MNIYDPKLDSKKSTMLVVDSCACGLAVLKSILPYIGDYNVIYFADMEYNPLGLKTKEQLSRIISSWYNISFNKTVKIDTLILACNTASIASKTSPITLPHRTLYIINMVDAFGKLLKGNDRLIQDKMVGLMATRSTINSRYYQSMIKHYKPKGVVDVVATRCERTVAHDYFETEIGKKEIACELSDYANHSLDTIILACTCFGHIKRQIAIATNPETVFIDPSDYVYDLVKESLDKKTYLPKQHQGIENGQREVGEGSPGPEISDEVTDQ